MSIFLKNPPSVKTQILNQQYLTGLHAFPFRQETELTDFGINKLNLTKNGTITWEPTKYGYSHKFGGAATDYFTTGDIGSQPPNIWTFELFLKLNSTSNQYFVGYAELPGSGVADRRLYIDALGNIGLQLYDGADKESNWGAATAGEYYHIIGGTNGSDLHLTINGISASTTSVSNGGYTSYGTPELILGYGTPYGGSAVGTDAQMYFMIVHNYYIPPIQARVLTNPTYRFNLYKDLPTIFPIVAAGGGTTLRTLTLLGVGV